MNTPSAQIAGSTARNTVGHRREEPSAERTREWLYQDVRKNWHLLTVLISRGWATKSDRELYDAEYNTARELIYGGRA